MTRLTGFFFDTGATNDVVARYGIGFSPTWGANKDFIGITTQIKKVIYSQKFEGAAADMLNANIIARELGLSDKVQNEHTGANGTVLTAPVFNFNPIKPKDD